MNILIVEDDAQLGPLMGELLRHYDRMAGRNAIAGVRVAVDFNSAVEFLPEADVVLCDGEFPISEATGPAENWSLVTYRASHLNIPTVIYSGNEVVVRKAGSCGLLALAKPAPASEVYDALMFAYEKRRAMAA